MILFSNTTNIFSILNFKTRKCNFTQVSYKTCYKHRPDILATLIDILCYHIELDTKGKLPNVSKNKS